MDEKIAEYLKDRKEHISSLYTWTFDASIPEQQFGIVVEGADCLEKTVSLKNRLREYISDHPDAQEDVATYFITKWGGIRRFSKAWETVTAFSSLHGSSSRPADFKPGFKSVSSWSKWASLVCPAWACIYDARVAYSINAINYLTGGEHKIFPTPDGRNTRLGILDVSTLLLERKIRDGDSNNPKDIEAAHFIPESDAYLEYLDLVASVSNRLWNDSAHIHEVEMLLFALADADIYNDVFAKVSAGSGK